MTYGSDFTEKELLNDLLISENHIASSYNSSIIETTSKNLRNILSISLSNVQDCQFEVLGAMNQRGWYKFTEVNSNNLENAKKKFITISNELL
ncbi:spore coat protein [Paramaledivibacter caminithermalis]|jgi:spore coat protein CotF|uniref:Coat F domain-containing protein n=1 Tax=Paramaledivibacter caminithermalis (strain DSM 15212 / CIP 107654 / DViRD3) TaxID=1121301 RepID=A0A1M6QKL3_PARC5|nr:spore coat protein [Paramaledivibacter caminithermalis]SHK20708.1 Coat F domain-containing protein [Paramaledivibacter caminithermalis DSM 15212]